MPDPPYLPPAPAAHPPGCRASRATAGLDRALARLAAARPPAIVGVVAADAAAERWLAGSSSGAARTLLVVLAGAVEDVALGYRQAWQAIELSGGVPSAGGRLRELAQALRRFGVRADLGQARAGAVKRFRERFAALRSHARGCQVARDPLEVPLYAFSLKRRVRVVRSADNLDRHGRLDPLPRSDH